MNNKFDDFSKKLTASIGSTKSLLFHSIFFVGIFSLRFFGVAAADILLILTTIVSLEAIYLSIFIQISVNRQAKELEEVSEDIEEIQKDVEEIQEDVEEVSEDIDEIQKDVEDISEEEEIEEREEQVEAQIESDKFKHIEETLQALLTEVTKLKSSKKVPTKSKSTKVSKKK